MTDCGTEEIERAGMCEGYNAPAGPSVSCGTVTANPEEASADMERTLEGVLHLILELRIPCSVVLSR